MATMVMFYACIAAVAYLLLAAPLYAVGLSQPDKRRAGLWRALVLALATGAAVWLASVGAAGIVMKMML